MTSLKKVSDTQRNRVYLALRVLPVGHTWKTVEEVRKFITVKIQTIFENTDINLQIVCTPKIRHARCDCSGLNAVIQLPKWAMSENILLHELAHIGENEPPNNWHGPHFCRRLLDLVLEFMGIDEAYNLAQEFKKFKVEVANTN